MQTSREYVQAASTLCAESCTGADGQTFVAGSLTEGQKGGLVEV